MQSSSRSVQNVARAALSEKAARQVNTKVGQPAAKRKYEGEEMSKAERQTKKPKKVICFAKLVLVFNLLITQEGKRYCQWRNVQEAYPPSCEPSMQDQEKPSRHQAQPMPGKTPDQVGEIPQSISLGKGSMPANAKAAEPQKPSRSSEMAQMAKWEYDLYGRHGFRPPKVSRHWQLRGSLKVVLGIACYHGFRRGLQTAQSVETNCQAVALRQ